MRHARGNALNGSPEVEPHADMPDSAGDRWTTRVNLGRAADQCDRSEERRVGKSVDLGGRRIIKKKKNRELRFRAKVGDFRQRAIAAIAGVVGPDVICGLFFFSSRRRHTRLQGDWSSDVCSSDLWNMPGPARRSVEQETWAAIS